MHRSCQAGDGAEGEIGYVRGIIAYLDCSTGAAGDMLLAAFVDAGLPVAALESAVRSLGLDDEVRLAVAPVRRGGFRATHLTVRVANDGPARTVPDSDEDGAVLHARGGS